jgi:hypothetical protein
MKSAYKSANGKHGKIRSLWRPGRANVGIKNRLKNNVWGEGERRFDSPGSYRREVNTRAVESESEGILGGVGVGKDVPTPTPTSI